MTPLLGPVHPPAVHLMSWNIGRRTSPFAVRPAQWWRHRAHRVQARLRAERPTVLGVQEAMPDQTELLLDALGPHYRAVGRGRSAEGTGEGCPVVYDARRLRLRAWSQQWLSERPLLPGSTAWGAPVPRIMVSAAFTDTVTRARFTVINTHLDAFSARARLEGARLVRDAVGRVRPGSGPVLVLGDLNAPRHSPPLSVLLGAGTLGDSWSAARRRVGPEWDTYVRGRRPRQSGRRVDWILSTPDVEVLRAGVDPRRVDGRWPSDHLAVHAVVAIPTS